ncbi:MAG: fibronectin type III domain-containing protein, partial [Acidimicrobiia bacterium]|nr:fibronectin type III domain-containing protein [Acidimicrobiia bacterium]
MLPDEEQANLARLALSSAELDSSFRPDPDKMVRALVLSGGRLFVGGSFDTIGGLTRTSLASLDPVSGTVHAGFDAQPEPSSWNGQVGRNDVHALAATPSGDRIFAGGDFARIGGTAGGAYLGALDPATGLAVGPPMSRVQGKVLDVAVSADGAAVFGATADWENELKAWNVATGSRLWSPIHTEGDVQAADVHADRVYFGFHDSFVHLPGGGDDGRRILAADRFTGQVVQGEFSPTVDSYFGVWAIDAEPQGLVAGGTFTTFGGVPTRGVAFMPIVVTDTSPPSTPTGLSADQTTISSTRLRWNPSTDNDRVDRYQVYRDGLLVGTPTATELVVDGLDPATSYEFRVRAIDPAGNQSSLSSPITVTTPARTDVTPPSTPSGLSFSGVTTSSLELRWSPSTDNVGVTGYRVLRNGEVAGVVTSTSFVDTGLAAATTYRYRVQAFDASDLTAPPATAT